MYSPGARHATSSSRGWRCRDGSLNVCRARNFGGFVCVRGLSIQDGKDEEEAKDTMICNDSDKGDVGCGVKIVVDDYDVLEQNWR